MFFKPAQIVMVRIDANVEWSIAQDPDSGEWVGVCPALNLNAIGDTIAEVHQCAAEAMQLLFSVLFKEGQLEAFLHQHGWQPQGKLPERGSKPLFDTTYSSRMTRARELVSAGT